MGTAKPGRKSRTGKGMLLFLGENLERRLADYCAAIASDRTCVVRTALDLYLSHIVLTRDAEKASQELSNLRDQYRLLNNTYQKTRKERDHFLKIARRHGATMM